MGTLDPMADGVLPVGIGKACRLFDYFLDKQKIYLAEFKFGTDFDTLDTTGTPVHTGGRIPTLSEIEGAIPFLLGDVLQYPPLYSAKNVNGERAYVLARKGVQVELEPKSVHIESIEARCVSQDTFSFKIVCGGGTYIRSVARDLGKLLGTYAAMSALTRLQSGCFKIEHSVDSDILTKDNISSYIIPTEDVISYEKISLYDKDAGKVKNGVKIKISYPDGFYKVYLDDMFYGIGEIKDNCLKIKTKLC